MNSDKMQFNNFKSNYTLVTVIRKIGQIPDTAILECWNFGLYKKFIENITLLYPEISARQLDEMMLYVITSWFMYYAENVSSKIDITDKTQIRLVVGV